MKNKIKEVRISKGIKQKELAEMLKVTPPTVAQYENENNNTKIETLEKIAAALGCSIVDLIDKSDYEIASQEEKRQVLDSVWKEANSQFDKASSIVKIAGYEWVLVPDFDDIEEKTIYLADTRTGSLYAVESDYFTDAVDGSLDFIEFKFKKMMESAKVVSNGRKTEER